MLSTLLFPTSGTATIAGHDINKEPNLVRKNIGMVFQDIILVSAGIIPQAILFVGIFSGISIVQDRLFGFFKEIMIAPISRTTITV